MRAWAAVAAAAALTLAQTAWAEEADEDAAQERRAFDGAVESLPEVVVRPPAVFTAPGGMHPPDALTPLRHWQEDFDVPAAVSVEDGASIRQRRMSRSLPDALLHLPGVLVQKTAPLQSSPFIRGFTGYRNLLLIDGIRLNNSAFRAGPNQYWNTIDGYTIDRLEVVRGPMSVLYGSDAVGGTVNVIPNRRKSFAPGTWTNGLVSLRGASGENSFFSRVQTEGNHDGLGWLGGITAKRYGDIVSGGGYLPGTGGIRELDGDLRLDAALGPRWTLTLAAQHVGQVDAPRTHKTVQAVPFHGTTVGSELRRDYDQERDLVYARARYDGGRRAFRSAELAASWHRHYEERDRLRTGDRRDLSGFELYQLGLQGQATSCTPLGVLTYGFDGYHDAADTWKRNYVGGVLDGEEIQGPFGDDSDYDLLGLYVQDELTFGCLDLVLGARFTYARANADRVEDPVTGEVISVSGDWTNVVGSVRALYHLGRHWNVYAGVGQAFRAPTLYDLTSFDVTGFVDTPSPGLDAENFLSFEGGVKTEYDDLAGSLAGWYTILDDTIIRSPTGAIIDGTPEVRADNIGDGWVWGLEADVAWRFAPSLTAFATASWMDGEADELDPATGARVRSPLSRQKPFSTFLGLRWERPGGCFWAQAEWGYAAKEDRLSLSDEADTQRIPPGGTPSWSVVNLRGGVRLGEDARLGVSLENLFDENYRIHGSGQNEPGFNLVVMLEVAF